MAQPTHDLLKQRFGAPVGEVGTSHGMTVVVVDRGGLAMAVRRLQSEFDFDLLLDVTAIDWPQRVPRFEVVYHLYSTKHCVRIRVKTAVPEQDPVVDSLVSLYGSAGFMERECREMFGMVFRGNADVRPILLYEGFVGHPLRKDYPKQREQPLVRYRS